MQTTAEHNATEARRHHEQANHLLNHGKTEEALAQICKGIALAPNNTQLHVRHAQILLKLGRLDEAEAPARAALELDEANPHLLNLLAEIIGPSGRLDEALVCVERAVALQPNAAGFQNHLCYLLWRKGNIQEAIVAARTASRLDPDNYQLQRRLSDLLLKMKDADGALWTARRGIELCPDDAVAHEHYGHVLLAFDRFEEATVEFRASIDLEPTRLSAIVALKNTLESLGAVEEATGFARKAMDLAPSESGHHAHLASLLAESGDLAGAEAAYVRAAELNPSGDYANALQEVRSALAKGASSIRIGQGPGPNQVMPGSDGWLFHRIDGVLPQICEGNGFSERNLSRTLSLWEVRQAWCLAKKAEYRILIVPERHVIYADKLPDGYAPHPGRPALRLLQQADQVLRPCIIYPEETLRLGRATRDVCYKTDVHWTRYGAYLAYRELMLSIPRCAEHLIRESELQVQPYRLVGSMTLWLNERTREHGETVEPPKVEVDEVSTNRTFKTGQVDVFETPFPDRPTLVLFRTSNSTHLLPFFYHHFSRIVAVATTAVHFDLLRSEQPDVVISELPERYLAAPREGPPDDRIFFPADFEIESFEDSTGMALPLPRRRPPDPGSSALGQGMHSAFQDAGPGQRAGGLISRLRTLAGFGMGRIRGDDTQS